jgi:hypothetical protein
VLLPLADLLAGLLLGFSALTAVFFSLAVLAGAGFLSFTVDFAGWFLAIN